jgi:peroxiredoxin
MSEHVALGKPAPDFELTDVTGRAVRLSDYRGSKNVVLVFSRGFL